MKKGFLVDKKNEKAKNSEYGPLHDARTLPIVTRMRLNGQNHSGWQKQMPSNRLGTASRSWALPSSIRSSGLDNGSVRSGGPSVSDTALSTRSSTWGSQLPSVEKVAALSFADVPAEGRHDETKSVSSTTISSLTLELKEEKPRKGKHHDSSTNKYANCLLHPFKTTNVPKSALHALYGKDPFRKIIASENYYTWHNSGPPHELRWTSLFVCPLRGEFYLSAQYGTDRDKPTGFVDKGLVWYSKKTNAEHGAAARAYDCLILRNGLNYVKLAWDEPYLEMCGRFDLPDSVPEDVRHKAFEKQRIFQKIDRAMCIDESDKLDEAHSSELAWITNRSRDGNESVNNDMKSIEEEREEQEDDNHS